MKIQNYINLGKRLDTLHSEHKYLIDNCISDVYLLNKETDTSSNAIRPKIYIALDIYSKLIAGVYVDNLNDKFFNGVKNVIYNCNEDKIEFCKKYNIEIKDEWPLAGTPLTILLDVGNLGSNEIRKLVEELHVAVEYDRNLIYSTSGSMERLFVEINNKVKKQPENKFDIYDFTRVVLNTVIEYNKRIIQKYNQI